MGSGLVKKKSYKGLTKYAKTLTNEEQTHYNYCVNNNYRISPKPATQGLFPDLWFIEIRLGPYKKGEKAHLSPSVYTHENIHQEVRRMQKYYYDKHKK